MISPASYARLLIGLVSIAGLVACGGGDPSAPALGSATTTLSGAVVKGPVAGANVCAYSLAGSSRGPALGSCSSSDAAGNYTLSVPAASGALWLEATGGSYTDEVTAALASLPAGAPLTSLVNATGGNVTAMLTPLTTLALNTARNAVGASGTLDMAAFNAGAAQVLAAFGLPAALDIGTTLPAFGSAINDYGTALTTISRMVSAGFPLAQILNTAQVSALQAVYAAAASGTVTPGPIQTAPLQPEPTPTPGTISASGSVAVSGASADFTPQSDGFEVSVEAEETAYRFFRKTPTVRNGTTIVLTSEINVTIPLRGEPSVTYLDAAAGFTVNYCISNCGVTVASAAGTTHPVTVTFANSVLSGNRTLNGSLTGDASGALWSPAELPRTTDGLVGISGTNVGVRTATDNTLASGTFKQRSIVLNLVDGSVIVVSQTSDGPFTASRVVPPATSQSCIANCAITVVDSDAGTSLRFAATPLSNGVTLSNTIFIGKVRGTLTSPQLGMFTPTADSATALNDLRTLTFNNLGSSASSGISLVTVEHRAGRVVSASVTTGIASTVHGCFEVAAIGRPACSGITVGADGRSLTFANTALAGGAVGAAVATITLDGTLQGKGL